jgi:hypothetical protein
MAKSVRAGPIRIAMRDAAAECHDGLAAANECN